VTAAAIAGGDRSATVASAPIARLLLSADPAQATAGVAWLRERLDAREADLRRQERERVRREREQRKADELRQKRDRAVTRAATLGAELAEVHARAAELGDEVTRLHGQLVAGRAQLERARAEAEQPQSLAERLLRLIAAPARDTRDVQSGEPQRRTGALSPAALAAAGRQVGVPDAAGWLPALLGALARPRPAEVLVGVERTLQVEVLGGGDEIGGSCVLVTAGGTRLLIDAGIRPGGRTAQECAPPRIGHALRRRIDAVVVTHAHNDHAGWVPVVLREQPQTPVYATGATIDLLGVLWSDSLRTQARDLDAAGTSGGRHYEPRDVTAALEALIAVEHGTTRRVGELTVELFPAGHILGASGVVVHAGTRRVVVSGDVSKTAQYTVGGIDLPSSAKRADLLLLESTYAGQGRRRPRSVAVGEVVEAASAVAAMGGRLLVPAFAFGRAQELAMLFATELPGIDVLVDGLARDVAEVYEQHPSPSGTPLRIFGASVSPVPRGRTAQYIQQMKSGVVIATSGMLTGGPVLSWARSVLPDPASAVMLVGFQSRDSVGFQLRELASAGTGKIDLPAGNGNNGPVEVNARVVDCQLGAHASEDELIEVIREVTPDAVMPVHGTRQAQRALAERLARRGQPTVAPTSVWRAEPA
jgi:Cft2 family RNA processing exonuclease